MEELGKPATVVQTRRGSLLGPMLVTGSLAVYSFVMALVVDDDLYRALYALGGIHSGWVSGIYLGQYTVLTRFTVLIRGAVEAPDREAVLDRLHRSVGAYPNLWPSAVPIIAAALGLIGVVVLSLATILAGAL